MDKKENKSIFPGRYPPYGKHVPKKNVLVISCIDLRLTDDMVRFLHHDNLANRYDHFILAGSSLCTCVKSYDEKIDKVKAKTENRFHRTVLNKYDHFRHWRKNLKDHIELAVKLHHIKDVYIIEHVDCGAYKGFLDPVANKEDERGQHAFFARTLADEIYAAEYYELEDRRDDVTQEPTKLDFGSYHLNVHCFLINLRGDVELLYSTADKKR